MIDYRMPTPSAIGAAQYETLAAAEGRIAQLLAVPAEQRTYDRVLGALEEVSDLMGQAYGRYGFMSHVAVEADVRQAAQGLRETLEKWSIELSFREDVHAVVAAFAATPEAAALTGERARLLERTLRDYRRNGFELPAEQRARVKELNNRLVELDLLFEKHIDEWDDAIWVKREELAGLPDSYISRLRTKEHHGQAEYRVSLDYPEFFPFMDGAESEALRRELMLKQYRKGGPENVAVLEEAIAVRDELARLLGYESWAAYVLEIRMARTPAEVRGFLADLRERMLPLLQADLVDMTAAKRAHTGRPDAEVQLWDWRFYHTRIRRERYAVDEFEVAKYFPLDAALDMLFFVYQTLLGVRFEPVEPANAWHPDVRLFRIIDTTAGEDATIAHFYMDLFPRDNKYGHAAAFTLRGGRRLAGGSYQQPVSAIVANFTKPGPDQPSLLRHSEVETLFHEFGHILHQTLTRAECLRFSGSRTERDFVEAPSQMLEQWVWLPEVLGRFSRHVDTGVPLPESLLQAMVAARRLHQGVLTCRQLYFAHLDMAYHAAGGRKDTTAIAAELHPICGFAMPEGTHWQSGFGHLFGYDSGYYGYLWSEVFADDMFTRFETAGTLSQEMGLSYRRMILERGGSVDGSALVRDFLGREPDSAAFLRNKGLDV